MAKAAKISSAPFSSGDLYERDYHAWCVAQARALRERQLDQVDWPNVAEEIEDLGKNERRALRSRIMRLLEHLLKLAYARDRLFRNNARGWELSVRNARDVVRESLDDNPSLRAETGPLLLAAYRSARNEALKSLRLPDTAIPEAAPWIFAQIIDDAFLPVRHG